MFHSFEKIRSFTDSELIESYRNSLDERYLSELFSRYAYLVYFLCNKYFETKVESDDAAIEIFAKIAHQIVGNEINNFRSWLYHVTKNFCIDKVRKNNNIQCEFVPISDDDENLFMQFPQFDRLMGTNEDQVELLQEAVRKLDPEQKECVKLFYFKKKSYNEIMEIKQWDMDKVRSRLQNARRNIIMYLEKRGVHVKTSKV
ncbi:sigma-70 family RNA polymerase sigma factor [bacterium]|nr:sigma-70 family RNA polymerase sigma factor [bacterium]